MTMENLMKSHGSQKYESNVTKLKTNNQESQSPYGIALSKGSMPSLCKAVQKWFESGELAAGYNKDVVGLVSEIPTEVIADLTCRVVLDSVSVEQPLTATAMRVGSFLEEEARLRSIKKTAPDKWKIFEDFLGQRVGFDYKKYSSRALAERMNLHANWQEWSNKDKVRTGMVFVDLFQKSTGLVELGTIIRRLKQVPILKPTAQTKRWIEKYNEHHSELTPLFLPASSSEGYRSFTTCLFKTRNKQHMEDIKQHSTPIPMAALMKLQGTAWKVNSKVLEVAEYFWKNQYPIAEFPPFKDDIVPVKPHDIDTNKDSRSKWRKEAAKFYKEDLKHKSKRLCVSKTLWIANKYKSEDEFFFPHQFDFRGRAYAVPNFLNYQGSDLSRGLLEFSKGKPMSERGVYWFIRCGKNLWGGSDTECPESWFRNNKENIHTAASDPTAFLWWSDAEKPWQFLAWVFEASLLLRRELTESRFPVSVDASSNGLQIMSMLLKYKEGARATNCISNLSKPPSDIYTMILNRVELRIMDHVRHSFWLPAKLDRKLIKSIIMAIPYGITRYRAGDLIREWYWEKDLKIFNDADLKTNCGTLASLILDTFYELFPDFLAIQKIFYKVDKPFSWTSPSGFPVYQHYYKQKLKKVKSLLFGKVRSFNYYDQTENLDWTKIKRAFIPNFIHSLDAAVMHVALGRFKPNSVAAIHDSFATHACNVDYLLQTLRDSNADMFGCDSSVFWKKIFNEKTLEKQCLNEIIENFSRISGDLVVDEVRQSPYMYR